MMLWSLGLTPDGEAVSFPKEEGTSIEESESNINLCHFAVAFLLIPFFPLINRGNQT